MLLAVVTWTLPLYVPGNCTFCALSAHSNQPTVMLDNSRGCGVNTGWVWGLLSGHSVSGLKGKCDDYKEVHFVDTICNCAGQK